VPLLILAHLGVLPFAACKRDDNAPVNIPQPVGSVPTAETAKATASVTVTPSATVTATVTLAPTAAASAQKPAECRADNDCEPQQVCVRVPLDAGAGRCAMRQNYFLGRPLVVDGEARVAAYVSAPVRTDLESLMNAAREEHASIAAFARTVSELMALGAPAWLLFETQDALADEIRHTEMTLDLIESATGERPILGRLAAAIAPLRSDASELLRDVFNGGCVGETLAAAHAESLRDEAETDELRAFYDTLFRDEAKHAALAFKMVRWLISEMPELASVMSEEKTRFMSTASFEPRALVGPLLDLM